MKSSDALIIRRALQNIPRAQSASVGSPPDANSILFLPSHASALDPDISLVIGNRGMGKTFWATALVDNSARAAITRRGGAIRAIASLKKYKIGFAFSDRQGVQGVNSKNIEKYKKFEPEDYWRVVVLDAVRKLYGFPALSLKDFDKFVGNPEAALQEMSKLDAIVYQKQSPALILFDQLDQLADDWGAIQRTTQGILKLALACRSYRAIRLKIFMRPDQAADEELFRFSDASKIIGPAATLRWYAVDLFGLLFKWIWSDPAAGAVMEKNFGGLKLSKKTDGVPNTLLNQEIIQRTCFEGIAGLAMGSSTKRGRPYTWLITHLADGKQQISPRSFLTAISFASEHPLEDDSLAIDYKGIHEGVAEASNVRHLELKEDYPWIDDALIPLRGQTVPAWREDFYDIWINEDIPHKIMTKFADSRAPLEIIRADNAVRPTALERSLVRLGVLEDREDERINVPDIFRISAGIKRKGGVPPQRRKGY